jgi:DNA-binding response OmpR family regulator
MSTPTDALIVLVEDDKEIQRLVRDLLVREGFSVGVAESGAALDQVLAGQRPDLVILDLMLPVRMACRSAVACARAAARCPF